MKNIHDFYVNRIELGDQGQGILMTQMSQDAQKCLQRTGIGLKHPCLTSPQKLLSEITNMKGQMDRKIRDQVMYSLIE